MKSSSQDNTYKNYLTHKEGKSVVATQFNGTLKLYQKMCELINFLNQLM